MQITTKNLFSQVKILIENSRKQLVRTVNSVMVYTYFEIGKIIVEHEQNGEQKAKYGQRTLSDLSKKLTKEFFTVMHYL